MPTVVVCVDLDARGRVTATTGELLSAAARISEPVAVVAVDQDPGAVVARLGELGAARVQVAVHPSAEPALSGPATDAVIEVVHALHPVAVLAAHTRTGRDVAGRAAVRLGTGLLTDAVHVAGPDPVVTHHSVLGGRWRTTATTAAPAVITLRPGAVDADLPAVVPTVGTVQIVPEPWAVEEVLGLVDEAPGTSRPDLRTAAVVVAGGRGVGSAEQFALVEQLADVLGGAVGASRAAVDAGYASPLCQVGQTGAVVSPELYVALGISGAAQHLAGMSTARTVVAVDLDPHAPIVDVADLAVLGDLHTLVPALVDRLQDRARARERT